MSIGNPALILAVPRRILASVTLSRKRSMTVSMPTASLPLSTACSCSRSVIIAMPGTASKVMRACQTGSMSMVEKKMLSRMRVSSSLMEASGSKIATPTASSRVFHRPAVPFVPTAPLTTA